MPLNVPVKQNEKLAAIVKRIDENVKLNTFWYCCNVNAINRLGRYIADAWPSFAVGLGVACLAGGLSWLLNPWFIQWATPENRLTTTLCITGMILVLIACFHWLHMAVLHNVYPAQFIKNGRKPLARFAELLSAHLEAVNQTNEGGVLKILESLQEVNGQSESLLSILSEQKATTEEISRQHQKQVEHNAQTLKNLADYQSMRDGQIIRDGQRIAEVLQQIERLGGLTRIIRKIAFQTKILALNAAIEAARAGDAGRGFSVVADEVRKLAQETDSATQEIDHAIANISEHAEKNLSAIISTARSDKETRQLQAIADDLSQTNQAFDEISTYLSNVVDEARTAMDVIHTRILDALGQMQFQDISRQQIEQVKSAFAQFAENSDWSAIEGMIDELKQEYVMQAQHETHGKVTGERIESEDRPAIELF